MARQRLVDMFDTVPSSLEGRAKPCSDAVQSMKFRRRRRHALTDAEAHRIMINVTLAHSVTFLRLKEGEQFLAE